MVPNASEMIQRTCKSAGMPRHAPMCTLSTPTPDPATASVAAFWLWLMMMFLTVGQETKARGENGKWRYLREEAGQRESCG